MCRRFIKLINSKSLMSDEPSHDALHKVLVKGKDCEGGQNGCHPDQPYMMRRISVTLATAAKAASVAERPLFALTATLLGLVQLLLRLPIESPWGLCQSATPATPPTSDSDNPPGAHGRSRKPWRPLAFELPRILVGIA